MHWVHSNTVIYYTLYFILKYVIICLLCDTESFFLNILLLQVRQWTECKNPTVRHRHIQHIFNVCFFAMIWGSTGSRKFFNEKWGKLNSLSRAQTCFKTLDLPLYLSTDVLYKIFYGQLKKRTFLELNKKHQTPTSDLYQTFDKSDIKFNIYIVYFYCSFREI